MVVARPEEGGKPSPSGQTPFGFLPGVIMSKSWLLWRSREAPLSPAGLGLENPARVASKGSVLTPLGIGFMESFLGCSFKGHLEAETQSVGSVCVELSLLAVLISLLVCCFWLSQKAWDGHPFPAPSPL